MRGECVMDDIARYVYLFVPEGETDIVTLKVLLFSFLKRKDFECNKISNNKMGAFPSYLSITRVLSDLMKVAPTSSLMFSIIRNMLYCKSAQSKKEVIIVILQPLYLWGRGYESTVAHLVMYLKSGILQHKSVPKRSLDTRFELVGVLDIDVLLHKPWKPSHEKNVHNTLSDILHKVVDSDDNFYIKDLIIQEIEGKRVSRLAKLIYEPSSSKRSYAWLLLWGYCKNFNCHKSVEDIEAEMIGVIAKQSQDNKYRERASQLLKVLKRSRDPKGNQGGCGGGCLSPVGGGASLRLDLILPLQTLAMSLGEKHPVSLYDFKKSKFAGMKLNKFLDSIYDKVIEDCELKEALEEIFKEALQG
ncbi:hypothetical protein IPA_02995 [Ignicoccus pacificus DSM 13166]|uniref:Uncharacterized protein n=1 Tax=Ignicoccus pacificus DSM 13166 TaxID=940294 RepID=A0A977PLE6_9CREN|nr:hypothetical protein IPA_02995 [Ignicoccus pacificus DSM 13166]